VVLAAAIRRQAQSLIMYLAKQMAPTTMTTIAPEASRSIVLIAQARFHDVTAATGSLHLTSGGLAELHNIV
jgi:hypothetical protein